MTKTLCFSALLIKVDLHDDFLTHCGTSRQVPQPVNVTQRVLLRPTSFRTVFRLQTITSVKGEGATNDENQWVDRYRTADFVNGTTTFILRPVQYLTMQ